MKNATLFVVVAACMAALVLTGCTEPRAQTSDEAQAQQQEQLNAEATSQTGMPAIKNFRERKILKDILELRDQDGLATYTYVFNEMHGKFVFVGESVGYGIPYATQYTNPEKENQHYYSGPNLPQADPNGLYAPTAAEGTWVLLKDPKSSKVTPAYMEQRITVTTFKLPDNVVEHDASEGSK